MAEVLEVEEVLEVVEMDLAKGARGGRNKSANSGQQSTDVQEGDAEVAATVQDKNKVKDIQEGSNSQSAAKLVRKSKRLRQEEP
uniref:Uncharacterized protein n=1 Tax=Tanacetum cinerariifolium TaxID=118510 RepID=A0A6L2NX31_TANCI|nr:hypothetical protein [Tanacetum cinerariifolium]